MSRQGPLAGWQVLVVEDSYALASDATDWLIGAGASVVGPAPNAEKACRLIERKRIDVAIVDINLNGVADFAVAARLDSLGIPFLFTTGYDRSVIPAAFDRAPRLEKPFGGEALIAAVASL